MPEPGHRWQCTAGHGGWCPGGTLPTDEYDVEVPTFDADGMKSGTTIERRIRAVCPKCGARLAIVYWRRPTEKQYGKWREGRI